MTKLDTPDTTRIPEYDINAGLRDRLSGQVVVDRPIEDELRAAAVERVALETEATQHRRGKHRRG